MERRRVMLYKFLFVSMFLQATIGVALGNQDTEVHATKRNAVRVIFLWKVVTDLGFTVIVRTLKQEEHHAYEVHCSRERSRAAWKIIEVTYQAQHKILVDVNEWHYGYCKKVFRAENFLNQHFDNRHYDLLNVRKEKRNPSVEAHLTA